MLSSLSEIAPQGFALPKPFGGSWRMLGLLRRMARNPMEAWPPEVYRAPYVSVSLLGQTLTFLCDPDLIHALFIDHAGKMVREVGLMRALTPALGRGILLADGAAWRWQRLAVAPAFRRSKIDSYLPAIVSRAEAAVLRWWSLPDGSVVDLAGEMMRLSFEIMAATLLAGDSTLDIEAIGAAIGDYLRPAPWPMLLSLLGAPDWVPYPGARRARRACAETRLAVRKLIVRRRVRQAGEIAPADDLMTLLLDTVVPGTERRMTDDELTDNLLTFIATGHETTALALFWLFQLLHDAPAVEARLLEEIETVTGGGRLQPGMLGALTYARQVVNEALRLYPPLPAATREMTDDVQIGPCRLPRGSRVILPIFAVHRHQALYDSPHVFDPDRFAPGCSERRGRYAFIPFGVGPRSCIGMGFATAEIVAALAVLLPKFRLRRAAGEMPAFRQHIALRPIGDTRMTVLSRPATRPAAAAAQPGQLCQRETVMAG